MIDSCDYENFFVNGDCSYNDLTSSPSINNSIVHINIRSLINEVNDLDGLLNILDFPKIVMLSETWIIGNSSLTNIDK